ncbi:MAG: class I SAM-dependent methyltransferase [Burkholderiales bacterium]|nr:class I SAM-dependent methyltransferase [Burkholderiales bacterium]
MAPAFRIVLRRPGVLAAAALRGHLGLAEAYFDGALDVEGSFNALARVALESGFEGESRLINRLDNHLHELRRSNRDRGQARDNAQAHYALPNAFYRAWLDDPLMLYTCAYWTDDTRTLEQAQRNKCDHVCRKLRLARGETFVDMGCGFGGFLLRAHELTGARGVGVNTTAEQVRHARAAIAQRGWADTLTVHEADFRDVPGQYDKLASIGVLEHAGRDQLAAAIAAHARALRPRGLGLLHFIGHTGPMETGLLIRKYVFPGGWIPALSDVVREMDRCGLEVLDVENLRRHYALTLDVWAERFEANWETIRALDPQRFDERFRRIWRTYLVGCAELFRTPRPDTHLFQIVFSKGGATTPENYPMTREFMYRP